MDPARPASSKSSIPQVLSARASLSPLLPGLLVCSFSFRILKELDVDAYGNAGNIAVAVPRAAVAATAPVANNAMNNRNNNTTGNVNVNAGTAVRNSGTSAGNNAAKTKSAYYVLASS